jgi:hypothetical protein
MVETKEEIKINVNKKKHIVLDLDGTLIDEYATGVKNNHEIIARPHLKEFFHFLFNDPRIASVRIWTNASRQWWDEMYAGVISSHLPNNGENVIKFDFDEIWTSSDRPSKHFVYRYCHERQRMLSVKPLRKYWQRKKKTTTTTTTTVNRMTRENTLIIDNTRETYMLNYGNAVPITTYAGDSKDIELLRVMQELDKILNLDNVRNRTSMKYCNLVPDKHLIVSKK